MSTDARPPRPFYKKKRYVIPALLLAVGTLAPDAEPASTPPQAFAAPAAQSVVDPAVASQTAEDLAAAQAAASKAAADRAAAETAAAKAASDKAAAEKAAKKAAAARAAAEKAAAQKAAEVKAAREAAKRAAAEQAAAAKVSAARAAARRAAAPKPTQSAVYYENCDAVRAAGAAPIRVGQPGYASHLDRDGDGQGCGAD